MPDLNRNTLKFPARLSRGTAMVMVMSLAAGAPAQLHAQTADLPTVRDISAVMAEPGMRGDAQLVLLAMAHTMHRGLPQGAASAESGLQDDVDWLRRLQSRYGTKAHRSPVLDPAAWLIHLETRQRALKSSPLVSPLGPPVEVYLEQVFDRSNERLAAVLLPELLWRVDSSASLMWADFLDQVAANEALAEALTVQGSAWLEDWKGQARPGLLAATTDRFAGAADTLQKLVEEAVSIGPPDLTRLVQLRYRLMTSLPELDGTELRRARAFLSLAGLVDGLHERRYFSFAEGLLALATSLLEEASDHDGEHRELARWLAKNLPRISSRYARSFAMVDPRINSALAAAFDVFSEIARNDDSGQARNTLRRELANAVAQLSLLIPDLDFYFQLPVRDTIAGGVDACTGIMARREEDGSPAMTRELFDDCQQSIVDLADSEARAAALSGDANGPFGDDTLQRELSVTPGQRINYGIGYLHDRYTTACEAPARPLPNPLEWAALANLLTWFAEQSPVYFQTPENRARLIRMREIGDGIIREIAVQVDCFAGSGAVLNDPVSRSLVDYRDALITFSSGINAAIFEFREKLLEEGADIALQRDSGQPTAYRPDDLMIGPCDPEAVCEMSGELSSTRALLGLFPDRYLVADPSGLGTVEICYEGVSWVNRRSEFVRADDTNVANYFGYLAFMLKGRYRSGEDTSEIFGFRFVSPNEQHYLFAAATEEVLSDECPVEWIGQRIVTPLRSDRGGVVPNRLTYLAAPRMLPSRVLANNWDRGAEWRDWFITGIGVERMELEPAADISADLNLHLRTLHRAEQAAIYQSALRPTGHGEDLGIESLYEDAVRLSTVKSLLRHQIMLFYPQLLSDSDRLRSAIAGQGGLLDNEMLANFRTDNVPVNTLNSLAYERLEQFQQAWQQQPEAVRRTGSIAGSLAHAMLRLNTLYETFFAEAPATVSPEPDATGG
jgi:hypothetical protein